MLGISFKLGWCSDQFGIMDTTLTTWLVLDNNHERMRSFNFSSYKPYKMQKDSDVNATNRELREERKRNCL